MSKKRHSQRGRHWLYSAPDDRKGAKNYNENIGAAVSAAFAKYPSLQDRPQQFRQAPWVSWQAMAAHHYMTPAKRKHMRKLCKYRDRSFYGYTNCPF